MTARIWESLSFVENQKKTFDHFLFGRSFLMGFEYILIAGRLMAVVIPDGCEVKKGSLSLPQLLLTLNQKKRRSKDRLF